MIKSVVNSILHLFYLIVVRFITLFSPIESKKIFFVSMNGNSYGDNMKCMSDYISNRCPQYEIVWAFSPQFFSLAQCQHKSVVINSFSFYYHIHTSKYIFHNVGFHYSQFWKRKGQIVVNTWHGTALKRIGTDVYSKQHNMLKKKWNSLHTFYNAELTDIFVSGSHFMSNIYREKLLYKKKIYEFGTPRNDIFFSNRPDVKYKIQTIYGINEKIILYAPTFRSDLTSTYYDIDLKKIKDVIEKMTGQKYCIMVRLHPKFVGNDTTFKKVFSDGMIDASSYPDMQDLLYVSDILITDYSSSMFDFMYTKRMVILYTPDKVTYDRGFYFTLNELPFVMINNNEEIENVLSKYNADIYRCQIDSFIKAIGSVEDGHATERLYSFLFQN